MAFWIFMFIITLLIPLTLLFMWYACPKFKNINGTSGYRSPRSKKSQEAWDFAQKYCSKISLMMFLPTILLPICVMPFFVNQPIDMIGWGGFIITMLQMISFVVIVFLTEKALKNKYE